MAALVRGVSAAEETDMAGGRKRPEPRSPPASGPVPFERISLLIDYNLILSLRTTGPFSLFARAQATNQDNSTGALPALTYYRTIHQSAEGLFSRTQTSTAPGLRARDPSARVLKASRLTATLRATYILTLLETKARRDHYGASGRWSEQ